MRDEPTLTWTGRGTPVLRDPETGRWRFGARAPVAPRRLPEGDLAILGEAHDAMSALLPTHRGRVRLCYVDPPFNTGNELLAYDDRAAHGVWLSALEERVRLARELLRDGGFFVAHINVVEQAYLKVLLDEIFGRERLIAQVSWQRAPDRTLLGQGSALIADQVEYLLCYVHGRVDEDWPRPQRRAPLSDKTLRTYGRVLVPSEEAVLVDELEGARIYAHAGYRLERALPSPETYPHLMRLTNQQPESTFQQALLARMPARGTLYRAEYVQARGKHRGARRRFYLDGNVVLWLRDIAVLDDDGLVRVADLNNFWTADEIPATGIAREGGVALRRGKKPERLLERVVSAFSRPGELVLDFFAGSGTTGAVAARLGRGFVLVEADPAQHALMTTRLRNAGAGFAEVALA
jgi:adenine-specific DNA-methyltransferase